jgi:sialic acid synthase SpsE
VNLNVIRTFRQAFDVPIGFSDHTTTITASLGAVALGASVIERHFTLDKRLDVPDAFFSADPGEMKALVQAIRELEQALGTGVKRPTPTEQAMRSETRKSVIARTDLRPGEVITKDKFIIKRPGTGVPPKLAHLVLGRRAKQAIKSDEVITWEKLD